MVMMSLNAAASARLCVETVSASGDKLVYYAAASARLCVETFLPKGFFTGKSAAASARLCVETSDKKGDAEYGKQPPPRGCVLKRAFFNQFLAA